MPLRAAKAGKRVTIEGRWDSGVKQTQKTVAGGDVATADGLDSPPGSIGQVREVAVRDVMDRSVLCLSEEQTLTEAATLMVHKKLERVPVVREGALVGLLTREDLVRRLFGP